ncbi:hypothetical protein [Elioraea sp.]|uniref:hypothetical protein n=1 Tax=Elioraea sp. TaxID=2185103 RepID=UPI00261A18F4|nr:hypothetical protein [Elioraea sp.]
MIGALLGRAWSWLAAAGAALAAGLAIYARGRAHAKRDAELRARRTEEKRQEKADEAARDYRRDGGAADRLRDGHF